MTAIFVDSALENAEHIAQPKRQMLKHPMQESSLLLLRVWTRKAHFAISGAREVLSQ